MVQQVGGYVLADARVDPVAVLASSLEGVRAAIRDLRAAPYLPLGGILHDLREAEKGIVAELAKFEDV